MKKMIFVILGLLFIGTSIFAQKPELVTVQGGTFRMGNDYYSSSKDESPEHNVTLSDFLIGKYEVTFEQFDKFCISTGQMKPNDGGFGRGNKPVMNVSWIEAVMYCNWLSSVEGLEQCYKIQRDSIATVVTCNFDAKGYRLPTEAEWEYAAKGGNKSKKSAYSGSYDPGEVAWYYNNSGGFPHEIGQKKTNELGIYDMSGNVPEWCWDYYSSTYYAKSIEDNPKGPEKGKRRVFRGGRWTSRENALRLTVRTSMKGDQSAGNVGFRVVRKP